MKLSTLLILVMLLASMPATQTQAQEKDVNGARNTGDEGTTFDTNVSFTLRMTLAEDDTPRNTAFLGEDVSITAVIRPEIEDIGLPADIIIVDYSPPRLRVRNLDGNFVNWGGKLSNLVPSLEGVILTDEMEVEVFTGQLGITGNHRIFVGFLVGDTLYFTPSALRFDILELAVEPSARDQAIDFFNSTISQAIVQENCLQCHRSGGSADISGAAHIFVSVSDSDHLSKNFTELEELHFQEGSGYILDKASNTIQHIGGPRLSVGSSGYNNFADFLDLLDQALIE